MDHASVIIDDDDDDEFAGIESITASQWVRDPIVNRRAGSGSSSKYSSQDATERRHFQTPELSHFNTSDPISLSIPRTPLSSPRQSHPSTPISWSPSPSPLPSRIRRSFPEGIGDKENVPPSSGLTEPISKGSSRKNKRRRMVIDSEDEEVMVSQKQRKDKAKAKEKQPEVVEILDESIPDERWTGHVDYNPTEDYYDPYDEAYDHYDPLPFNNLDHISTSPRPLGEISHIDPVQHPPDRPIAATSILATMDYPLTMVSDLDDRLQEFYTMHFRRGADKDINSVLKEPRATVGDDESGRGAGKAKKATSFRKKSWPRRGWTKTSSRGRGKVKK
ncbi:hypothetical protein I306_02107 [Cryptococcus gattii EJB2]|uniref:Uncharacterized protein n=1 Tax=Cryptococcus gattii EJB2 TaxID=1296103 RepID=A0ABR5BYD5_9TREE|nr:hypothetical protein I306_02107 [Cryptococcus gattii EJB2]